MVPGVAFDEVAVFVGSKSGAIADNAKTRQVDQRHLVPSGAAGGGGGRDFCPLARQSRRGEGGGGSRDGGRA